jgi:hypothetical protein
MKVEPGVDVAEVKAGQLADAAQPVAQGASVGDQRPRCGVVLAAAVVVGGPRGWPGKTWLAEAPEPAAVGECSVVVTAVLLA